MQKKGKQVVSSTKWGLGYNVVLRLMQCLTPTVSFDLFMDSWIYFLFIYFTSFCLFVCLPTFELTTFEQEAVFNKNRLRKYTITGDKHLQKKERGHFEHCSAHQGKTLCNLYG